MAQDHHPGYAPGPSYSDHHQAQTPYHYGSDGYRGHQRTLEDEDDDDEDDDDHDDDDEHSGFQTTYHSAYNTAYNSAYNSESEDVNMDGVAIKEDRDDDMTDAPSSVHPSSPSTKSAPSSVPQPLANIKPRPALRPLLPSRPTSPQPLNLTRGVSSDMAKDASSTSTSSSKPATTASGKTRQSAYKINGLNILNRNSLDSRTALEMIRRRRENHNHVERRRRDTLNSTILQIAEILPNCSSTAKLNKGTILRLALDHLRLYASFIKDRSAAGQDHILPILRMRHNMCLLG
ncbi:hypothetical protein BG005_009897 [Podila minutissima]|nr:hypothetical protein BG005_009897 [Podila minutissima]